MNVVGFHGTNRFAAERIAERDFNLVSDAQHRWLGSGIYFFQDSQPYAAAWAKVAVARQKQKDPSLSGTALIPAVVKANIDLTGCLDLSDTNLLLTLRNAYTSIKKVADNGGAQLPTQQPFTVTAGEVLAGYWDEYKGFGKNELDYKVINFACGLFFKKENVKFRTVRGVFTEGWETYENSWIFDKSHIAIAVRDPYDAMSVAAVFDV